jgi:hypothetical protein
MIYKTLHRKLKIDRQIQWTKEGQAMIYKTLHRKLKIDRQYNEQKDKQWSTKHYTENKR